MIHSGEMRVILRQDLLCRGFACLQHLFDDRIYDKLTHRSVSQQQFQGFPVHALEAGSTKKKPALDSAYHRSRGSGTRIAKK